MRHAMRRWACGLALVMTTVGAHAALKVYDATELSYDRYRVIKRLWVDSWRTAIGVPHHDTREAAVQALMQAAERVGADGLINVYCVGGTPALADHYCYGNAIKLREKPAQR